MGDVRSKTRSLGQILEKPCVPSKGNIFRQIIMKLGQKFCLDEILDEYEMVHVGSKTRLLGNILEKPCVSSGDKMFSLIFMKLGQSFCLDEILYIFENGSCGVKNYVTKSNHRRSYACNPGAVI